jgi:hypothetical protein
VLENAIRPFIDHNNQHPKPFVLDQISRPNPGLGRSVLQANIRLTTPAALLFTSFLLDNHPITKVNVILRNKSALAVACDEKPHERED